MDLATAMEAQNGLVTGASFVTYGDPSTTDPAAVADATITSTFGVPNGQKFALLSSGRASYADNPDQSGYFPNVEMANPYRGTWDATVLKVEIQVPPSHECLNVDFQFLSEEYPDFLGPQYRDTFLAELDSHTWTTGGGLTAPDNFAIDSGGNFIDINTVSMAAANAAGSPYGGATDYLFGNVPVNPGGSHSIFFSIFDKADREVDSTVFLDNLRTFSATTCEPGLPPCTGSSPPPGSVAPLTATPDEATLTGTAPYWTAHLEWSAVPPLTACNGELLGYEIMRRYVGNPIPYVHNPSYSTVWSTIAFEDLNTIQYDDELDRSLPCDMFEYRVRALANFANGPWANADFQVLYTDPLLPGVEEQVCELFDCTAVEGTYGVLYMQANCEATQNCSSVPSVSPLDVQNDCHVTLDCSSIPAPPPLTLDPTCIVGVDCSNIPQYLTLVLNPDCTPYCSNSGVSLIGDDCVPDFDPAEPCKEVAGTYAVASVAVEVEEDCNTVVECEWGPLSGTYAGLLVLGENCDEITWVPGECEDGNLLSINEVNDCQGWLCDHLPNQPPCGPSSCDNLLGLSFVDDCLGWVCDEVSDSLWPCDGDLPCDDSECWPGGDPDCQSLLGNESIDECLGWICEEVQKTFWPCDGDPPCDGLDCGDEPDCQPLLNNAAIDECLGWICEEIGKTFWPCDGDQPCDEFDCMPTPCDEVQWENWNAASGTSDSSEGTFAYPVDALALPGGGFLSLSTVVDDCITVPPCQQLMAWACGIDPCQDLDQLALGGSLTVFDGSMSSTGSITLPGTPVGMVADGTDFAYVASCLFPEEPVCDEGQDCGDPCSGRSLSQAQLLKIDLASLSILDSVQFLGTPMGLTSMSSSSENMALLLDTEDCVPVCADSCDLPPICQREGGQSRVMTLSGLNTVSMADLDFTGTAISAIGDKVSVGGFGECMAFFDPPDCPPETVAVMPEGHAAMIQGGNVQSLLSFPGLPVELLSVGTDTTYANVLRPGCGDADDQRLDLLDLDFTRDDITHIQIPGRLSDLDYDNEDQLLVGHYVDSDGLHHIARFDTDAPGGFDAPMDSHALIEAPATLALDASSDTVYYAT